VLVVEHLTGVDDDPEAQLGWLGQAGVALGEPVGKPGHQGEQPVLRHVGVDEDGRAVAHVHHRPPVGGDAPAGERLVQQVVHGRTQPHPILVGAILASEACDVDRDDGAVQRFGHHLAVTLRAAMVATVCSSMLRRRSCQAPYPGAAGPPWRCSPAPSWS
jgi:hypothetical protein